MLTDLLRRAETEAQNAGKERVWNRTYQLLRFTHGVRQSALLALREVGLTQVADDLEAVDHVHRPETS
jgi:hypothetical protein